MTNHMHVANFFPEAYEGKLEFHGKEHSIAEIATDHDLPPILRRCGTWVITTAGLESLTVRYSIEKERFNDDDWLDHMREKTWINFEDFSNAFAVGKEFVRLEII